MSAIAIQYAKMGQANRAAKLQAQALQLAQSVKESFQNAYLLQQMVQQYLDPQQYESAIQTAQAIRAETERTNTLNEIAGRLIEVEQLDIAVRAANALPKLEDKARFLVDVATHYIARGRPDEATEILARTFQTAKTIKGPESRKIPLNLAAINQLNLLHQLYGTVIIPENPCTPVFCNLLVNKRDRRSRYNRHLMF